jgi:fucose permease
MPANFGLVPVTLVSAFTCGAVLGLMGSIRLSVAKRLGVPDSKATTFALVLQLALVPMLLLTGALVDTQGAERVVIVCALLSAVAVALLAMSQKFSTALAAMMLVGGSSAGVLVSANVLMTPALFPDNPPASLNLGNVFFVLGTLIAPVTADVILPRIGFRRTMGLAALLCLVPALAAALTSDFPAPRAGTLERVLNDPVLGLVCLICLLYGPLENMIGTWSGAYLADMGIRERRAAWLVSAFWVVFLGSRLLTAFLLERGIITSGPEVVWLVLLPALITGVALGNLAGTTSATLAAWGMLMVALLLGPILPTLAGVAYRRFPDEPGTALGALYGLGALGSLVLVPVIGLYARRTSPHRALHVPAVVALVLTAAGLVLQLTK